MKKPTDIGKNRTGIATSPKDAKRTVEGAVEGSPQAVMAPAEAAALRLDYSTQAPPLGTMPPPRTLKGAAKAVASRAQGEKETVLLDKLGERLAFERGGTRLYELLLVKFDAASHHPGGPSRAELEEIRDDELRHFGLLVEALTRLGADPTAVTPCADVVGVATMGLVQVLSDPRTTFTQALDTILLAELGDNDGWAMLLELLGDLGQEEIAAMLRPCVEDERRHLLLVRTWLTASVKGQAGQPITDEDEEDEAAGASAPPP
jgi:rubrerythrin